MPGGRETVAVSVSATARRLPNSAEVARSLASVVPGPRPVMAAAAIAAFEALSSTRAEGLSAPRPITFGEIRAYSDLVAPLSSRDVGLILAQDAALRDELEIVAAAAREQQRTREDAVDG
jgi:hypothetical protein